MARKGKRSSGSKQPDGPKIPYALAQEMGTKGGATGLQGSKRGKSMFLVSQRKEDRKARRRAKKHRQPTQKRRDGGTLHRSIPDVEQAPPPKRRRMAPIELSHPPQADEQRAVQTERKPEKAIRTKFSALLDDDALQGTNSTAVDAEAQLQKELAKKLGVRKSKSKADAVLSLQGPGKTGAEAEGPEDSEGFLIMLPESSSDMESDVPNGFNLSDAEELLSSEDDAASDGLKEDESGDEDSPEEAAFKDVQNLEKEKVTAKYKPPGARRKEQGGNLQLTRRVTGLINRLSDANIPQISAEILSLMRSESRRGVMDTAADLLLQAVAEGPRATDRFSAVTAAFVSGLSARADAAELGANFTTQLAFKLEHAYTTGDSLSSGNLANLLAQLFICELLPAACIYTCLEQLRRRFCEQDVVLIHTLLKACGHKLRTDDPVAMKELVVGVHSRAAECRQGMSQRTEVMLELILDIKNNRQPKGGSKGAALEMFMGQGAQCWLKESKVADIQLRAVTWEKLLSPDKKGMWWLTNTGELGKASPLPKSLAAEEGDWSAELLQLATQQRMNTDVRRTVFCIVMGSEDYMDASEKLLRLPLKGEAQREIVRVAVDCCLQEAAWNPYYAALLKNVLAASQAHCVTAQYCIWDHLKDINRQGDRRIENLALLVAQLIVAKTLPLSSLRAAQLDAVNTAQEELMWRTFFTKLLIGPKDDSSFNGILKVLAQPHLQKFALAIASYLKEEFEPDAAIADREQLMKRSRNAQKLLQNMKRMI